MKKHLWGQVRSGRCNKNVRTVRCLCPTMLVWFPICVLACLSQISVDSLKVFLGDSVTLVCVCVSQCCYSWHCLLGLLAEFQDSKNFRNSKIEVKKKKKNHWTKFTVVNNHYLINSLCRCKTCISMQIYSVFAHTYPDHTFTPACFSCDSFNLLPTSTNSVKPK